MTRQATTPRSEIPRPREVVVDVVLVADETMSGRETCLLCENGFEPKQVMLRVRDFKAMVDYQLHRSCIERVLAIGPVDDADFEAYRAALQERYSD